MDQFFGPQVRIAISNKSHGPMNLLGHEDFDGERRANRGCFLKYVMKCEGKDTAVPALYHDNKVEIVYNHNHLVESLKADSIITHKKNLCLTMTMADCPTVCFLEPLQQVIALTHCGWRPLSRNIIDNTVEKMKLDLNCDPKIMKVYVGPGICHKEFEIGPDVALKFGWDVKNKIFFNLQEEIRKQLLFAGILEENILFSPECTHHSEAYSTDTGRRYKFFSHRRDHLEPISAQMCCMMLI